MGKSSIRVLCVDDHAVVREGIALRLELEPDITVVGIAASGYEAIELFRTKKPDVTLMDLQLPGVSGLEAIRAILRDSPGARVVVLTMYQGDEDIHRAMKAGALTYLLKDTLSQDLVRAIRAVHRGDRPMQADVEARLKERAAQPVVTPREAQILELISKGLRTKEIAAALNISEETAHQHTKNIFAKLKVSDRTAAVHVALTRGIIHIP